MNTIYDFPHEIKTEEHIEIPMTDGIRLSARIWRPKDSDSYPVPAVLEYIPYRKRDVTRWRDSLNHPYFAGHGYAAIRVDVRGSGESEGLLTDEYLQQELDDALEVIAWLRGQPWCDGKIGMFGISWGGFNSLQVAALRPAGLDAVISVSSSDDRYLDDVHYMGGCLLGDNLSWASVMFSFNSLPPDPYIAGDKWRQMWFDRLDGSGLWVDNWLRHQRRDDYWKHGSICEDFSHVNCPVMAISGWADGYSNAVFRMMSGLTVPRKGLIGPWSHRYPHIGVPGPAIGFLQLALRWWDRWLKGIQNDVMEGPMISAWMQDSIPPYTSYEHRPGRWIGEPSWPSPNIQEKTYYLADKSLVPAGQDVKEEAISFKSLLAVGLFAGKWCSYSAAPDLPYDQREEDGSALVFESSPLDVDLEIFGSPEVEIDIATDKPSAMVAVRLSDVAPDGKATRVTYGVFNLTHRTSHEYPEILEPGKKYRVKISLNGVAQVFPRGHRLRLSLSNSYWPLCWPSPELPELTVFTGVSKLILPVRQPLPAEDQLIVFPEAESAEPLRERRIKGGESTWRVVRDLATEEAALEVIKNTGVMHINEIDLDVKANSWERYSALGDDYQSVRGETYWERGFSRKDWSVETVTRTVLTSTPLNFHIHADLDAYEGGRRVYCRSWDREIPRDHV